MNCILSSMESQKIEPSFRFSFLKEKNSKQNVKFHSDTEILEKENEKVPIENGITLSFFNNSPSESMKRDGLNVSGSGNKLGSLCTANRLAKMRQLSLGMV